MVGMLLWTISVGSWNKENQHKFQMSVLNLTGEDADPVKSFVFREVSEYCRKKDQDDRISKEEMERQKKEERIEKNRAWRQRRSDNSVKTKPDITWKDDAELIDNNKSTKCDIL